jgi:hypothetical protein
MTTTTQPQPQPQESATISLAKRGDVVLVLDKGKEMATKLLVSSAFLSEASPVFEKMFSGRYAEGGAISSDNPGDVKLPDDDPACMTLLCRILHLQATEVPRQLDIVTLADLAVLCDKYACADAVRPWIRVWVLELLAGSDSKDCEKLIMVTFALDLPDEFYKVTQGLIRVRTFSVDMDVAGHGTDFIPASVFGTCIYILQFFTLIYCLARLQKGQMLYHGRLLDALNP